MSEQNFEEKDSTLNFIQQIIKYISYWKFILLSIVVSFVIAHFYLKSVKPVYSIYSTILLKDDQRGGSEDELSVLQQWGIASGGNNVDNEIEILSSWSLSKKVVEELGLNVIYSSEGILENQSLYKSSPYQVKIVPEVLEKIQRPITLKIVSSSQQKYAIELINEENTQCFSTSIFPYDITTPYGILSIKKDEKRNLNEGEKIVIDIFPIDWVTNSYRSKLNIRTTSKTTSVVYVSISDQNTKRGKDFINKLIEIYNREALLEKNQSALNIESFIAERLKKIGYELEDVKKTLENYKKQHGGVLDLKSDVALSMKERSSYSHQKEELLTQLKMIQFLENYMKKNNSSFETLPSNMGINDNTLINLSQKYNQEVLLYKNIKQNTTLDNPTVKKKYNGLVLLKNQIMTSISSVKQALKIAIKNVDIQLKLFSSAILKAPTQERKMSEIQRWETVKTSLFMILSRKREENALKLAVNTVKARVVDPAISSESPVYPKVKWVYLIALLIGLGIPITIIYIIDLLHYKVRTINDIEFLSKIPIVAELPIKGKKQGNIVVEAKKNDVIIEAFRNLRTNLKFSGINHLQNNILITSSMPGEGKTFVSINLAISLSLLEKKVLIVGLDVRKPVLAQALNLDAKHGVTNYLSGSEKDYKKLIQPSGLNENLDVLTSGRIPLNPGELVQSEKLDAMISELRTSYDYIILDTPPIGLVSDAIVLSRLADASLYVVRANYTHKKHLKWVNDIKRNYKLPNVSIILNGVKTEKGTYGYGEYTHLE